MNKKRIFILVTLLLIAGALLGAFYSMAKMENQHAIKDQGVIKEQGVERFMILTQDGRELEFNLQIADTEEEQKNGLMHVTHLDDDAGMAFLVDKPKLFIMWMKDTKIPLDMVFLDEFGEIVHIHWEAEPMSEDTITNNVPVMAVLELRGGITLDEDIRVGDYVVHPHFKNPIKQDEKVQE